MKIIPPLIAFRIGHDWTILTRCGHRRIVSHNVARRFFARRGVNVYSSTLGVVA